MTGTGPPVRLIARLLLFALAVTWLAGCVGTANQATRPGMPKAGELPAGLSGDELLTGIAACHLRRVAQTGDRGATDAVVIAAVERYDFTIAQMIARSNRLLETAADPSARVALRALTQGACEELAVLTGIAPSLVRFDASGLLMTTWIRVEGPIDEGFADAVVARLRREKAVGLIINSPGGSLYEARRLGRYLRENGLRVGVDGLCTSACVDVLAGGIERYVTPEARLGIHQSKVPPHLSTHEGGQLSVVAAVLYLREMGVDESIALAAAAVPNDRMSWISVPEALESGLATRLVTRL
ncbi:hypothetical protein F2Q65_05545 [Thiohalocapsa marina]|uniref:Uncharacterized protein n=1 Tax=Thiohalocapsa marina TaxID=424902 RepID=A0A5M8FP55_9GAMM|nr:ATP-dependent Clp protease proteolytic subunit [Thiohalocapsa marina]KAA6186264.1 hypothetical protein F2Q65_05545 [Thiohalocapsa marina]